MRVCGVESSHIVVSQLVSELSMGLLLLLSVFFVSLAVDESILISCVLLIPFFFSLLDVFQGKRKEKCSFDRINMFYWSNTPPFFYIYFLYYSERFTPSWNHRQMDRQSQLMNE